MLFYVPVTIDLYRNLSHSQRWTMMCLISFITPGGIRPGLRAFAKQAGCSKSTAGRHLASLVATGLVSRERQPGGVYAYHVDPRFLPRFRKSAKGTEEQLQLQLSSPEVSQRSDTRLSQSVGEPVPQRDPQKENPRKIGERGAPPRAGLSNYDGYLGVDWPRRLREWKARGFWLPQWGARPDEPGTLVPPGLLESGTPPGRSRIDSCPHCDEHGFVFGIRPNGSRAAIKCSHNRTSLDSVLRSIGAISMPQTTTTISNVAMMGQL